MPGRGTLKGGFGDGRELVLRLWDIPQIPVFIKRTAGYRTFIMSDLQVSELSHISRNDPGLHLTISVRILGVNISPLGTQVLGDCKGGSIKCFCALAQIRIHPRSQRCPQRRSVLLTVCREWLLHRNKVPSPNRNSFSD